MTLPTYQEFDVWKQIWPAEDRSRLIAPVRVGMHARTGKMLVGFDHVMQSMEDLFQTRFHSRELREYVGSFVPHLLGQNAVGSVIGRFWFSFASAIELWEPCYKVARIRLVADGPNEKAMPSTDDFRRGKLTFKMTGVYMPRGHLGDKTPEAQRSMLLRGNGANQWEASSLS